MSTKTLLASACALVMVAAGRSSSAAPTFLYNPGIYTAIPSSQNGGGPFPVTNLFDNSNVTGWAIDGFTGNNPQGRDEGWVSVTLNQSYSISDILFAPRKPTGQTDSIDRLYVWISPTPFAVDVTNASSTNAFLATPLGEAPSLTVGPFATFNDTDYPLVGTINGQYLLARLVNTSDMDPDRNLGGRTLVVGVVPEPSSLVLAALGGLGLMAYRRRLVRRFSRSSRTHQRR